MSDTLSNDHLLGPVFPKINSLYKRDQKGNMLWGEFSYGAALDALHIDGGKYGFNTDASLHWDVLDYDTDGMWMLNHLWTTAIRLIKKGEKVTYQAIRDSITIA